MSKQLCLQETFTPVKYFSIDRVFRNETLDATHLAEFHQIEGLVADRGLTLGDLMGLIHAFFKKLGLIFSTILCSAIEHLFSLWLVSVYFLNHWRDKCYFNFSNNYPSDYIIIYLLCYNRNAVLYFHAGHML